jgi:cbb3-type cytochrome oxidase maturation protein
MTSLYLLIPLGVVTVFGAIGIFIWAANSGQFDELDAASRRLPDNEP